MASAEGAKDNDTNQAPGRNSSENTTIELYSQLLASVKDISAPISQYDKRLTDLSNRMPHNSATTTSATAVRANITADTSNSTEGEPLFTTPANVSENTCGEGARPKNPHVQKTDISLNQGGHTCKESKNMRHKQ